LYIRCFDHRIGGLNCTHESFGLNHSECFQGHLFVLTLSIVEIKSDCIGSLLRQRTTAGGKKQETQIFCDTKV
jgi:hypothetical protein